MNVSVWINFRAAVRCSRKFLIRVLPLKIRLDLQIIKSKQKQLKYVQAASIKNTIKMVESNNNEESLRKVVSIYDSDETARILAQHDDNNQANIDMARKASGLEKQVSVEVKSSKQTVQDMKDFQNEYDQKIK